MAKHYVKWEYYENGVNGSISGETVNEIIEEIIGIMRKNKITVGTAQRILEDTVSSIVTDTQITQSVLAFHEEFAPLVHFQKEYEILGV